MSTRIHTVVVADSIRRATADVNDEIKKIERLGGEILDVKQFELTYMLIINTTLASEALMEMLSN